MSDTTTVGPVTDPREMTATYVRAMNDGDVEGLLSLYAPEAVSVWEPGSPISGAEHEQSIRDYAVRRPRMSAEVRESYVTGDTALLIVDWTMEIPEGDGVPAEAHTGLGQDVLRRGPDGRWRYVVDNPFGEV